MINFRALIAVNFRELDENSLNLLIGIIYGAQSTEPGCSDNGNGQPRKEGWWSPARWMRDKIKNLYFRFTINRRFVCEPLMGALSSDILRLVGNWFSGWVYCGDRKWKDFRGQRVDYKCLNWQLKLSSFVLG